MTKTAEQIAREVREEIERLQDRVAVLLLLAQALEGP